MSYEMVIAPGIQRDDTTGDVLIDVDVLALNLEHFIVKDVKNYDIEKATIISVVYNVDAKTVEAVVRDSQGNTQVISGSFQLFATVDNVKAHLQSILSQDIDDQSGKLSTKG